jgi:hypothetical protein
MVIIMMNCGKTVYRIIYSCFTHKILIQIQKFGLQNQNQAAWTYVLGNVIKRKEN